MHSNMFVIDYSIDFVVINHGYHLLRGYGELISFDGM